MTYEVRLDTVEAWKIIGVRPADQMNGQELEIEDDRAEGGHRTVHISAQDLGRSGVNVNPQDYFVKFQTGAVTVQSRTAFEKKWKPVNV